MRIMRQINAFCCLLDKGDHRIQLEPPKPELAVSCGTSQGASYGNHIQANIRSLIVLGANNPTMITAMPETTRQTDRTVSGHPPRLCSKLRNSAFTLRHHFRCCASVRHCQHRAGGQDCRRCEPLMSAGLGFTRHRIAFGRRQV